MGLFKKSFTNVAVIDVHSSSIGAAYVSFTGTTPTIVYSVRMPLEAHATEPVAEALPRTLDIVLKALVTEGAPALRSHSGSGHTDFALVAVAAPWQRSYVYNHVVEKERPFLFTKLTLEEAVKAAPIADGKGTTKVSDMLIATLLNGYEIENPYGKRAKRAELILMSSAIETAVMETVQRAVRKALHQHDVRFNAYLPEAYNALVDLYPHQQDFLVLDIGGDATDILLVKHGLLISLTGIAHGVNEIARTARNAGIPGVGQTLLDTDRNSAYGSKVAEAEAAWLSTMEAALAEIARQEPLPRSVLLLSDESVRDFLRRLLDVPQLRNLWLTDESLNVMPVLPSQFAPHFGNANAEGVDPALGLLALAARQRLG